MAGAKSKYKPAIKPKGRQFNFQKLHNNLQTEASTISLAQKEGILPTSISCLCGSLIEKYTTEKRKNGSFVYFQCTKRKCRHKVALRKNTIFDNSNLKMSQIFLLAYCFTQFLPYRKCIQETFDFQDGYDSDDELLVFLRELE